MKTDIRAVHALFCQLTGCDLRLGLGEYTREAAWYQYLKSGFTTDDLRLVIRYLQDQIRHGERRAGAVKFSNLIERLDRFEEDLALAKGWLRNKKPPRTPHQKAMQLLRPGAVAETTVPKDAKPVGYYIEEMRKKVNERPKP